MAVAAAAAASGSTVVGTVLVSRRASRTELLDLTGADLHLPAGSTSAEDLDLTRGSTFMDLLTCIVDDSSVQVSSVVESGAVHAAVVRTRLGLLRQCRAMAGQGEALCMSVWWLPCTGLPVREFEFLFVYLTLAPVVLEASLSAEVSGARRSDATAALCAATAAALCSTGPLGPARWRESFSASSRKTLGVCDLAGSLLPLCVSSPLLAAWWSASDAPDGAGRAGAVDAR